MKTNKIPTRIILSGLAGAGKSSVGKALAKHLGYNFRVASHYAREEAKRRGISIQELQVQLDKEPEFDRELDARLVHWGRSEDRWIMDYRLGCSMLSEAASIYLTVEETEAARRVGADSRPGEFKGDESAEDVLASIRDRNENMRKCFLKLYDIDFADESLYDHVVTTDGKDIDQVVCEILMILSNCTTSMNA